MAKAPGEDSMFTDEETKFLLDLLGRLTISPTAADASVVVAIVHSIVNKLRVSNPNVKV